MSARPRLRRALSWGVAVACVLVAAACDDGDVPTSTATPTATDGAPAPPSDAPSASPTPATEAGEPDPQPSAGDTGDLLLAWTLGGLPPGFVDAVAALPEVEQVTVVAGDLVDLVASADADGRAADVLDAGWAIPIDAIAIDPAAYAAIRVAAAGETADVIANLAPGEALLGATSAELRGLAAGATITLGGGVDLTVRGVVDDDLVGAAEVVVTTADAAAVGVTTDRFVLLRHRGDHPAVEVAVRGLTDVGMRVRAEGEWPWLRHGDAVLPQAYVKAQFGEFAYRPTGNGLAIQQDDGWVDEYLRTLEVPILGSVTCHRAMAGPLEEALAELVDAGLAEVVDPAQYAGCHHPRLVAGDDGVSRHAWGLAIDVNAADNARGVVSTQDPRLVEAFTTRGFAWGGPWLSPDAMHFEYLGTYAGAVPGSDDP
ncbi:MAG: M15 family metallopeptidase [Actinobacteria bacterium]|jgi:hypothetical protein|nr:M15 family metallopeptidase [Actinomycetota bacterium]